jgi:hypothetical protein
MARLFRQQRGHGAPVTGLLVTSLIWIKGGAATPTFRVIAKLARQPGLTEEQPQMLTTR